MGRDCPGRGFPTVYHMPSSCQDGFAALFISSTLCIHLWGKAGQCQVRGGAPPWQTKAGFLRPSSAPARVFTVSLPAEPALSPGRRPPCHRATAPHAHLPHRHLHPLQERQAHQVGARLLRGSARALMGMGCWLKAMGGRGALATKQASCVE